MIDSQKQIALEAIKQISGFSDNDRTMRDKAIAALSEPVFPERDLNKPTEQQGIFHKFEVKRVDGSDKFGGKHYNCGYFVLDIKHDKYAPAALRAYAMECAETHPKLSEELLSKLAPQSFMPNEQIIPNLALSEDTLQF